MNQVGYQIEYINCFKCKKNTVKIRKYYDKHLSDWVSVDCHICEECLNKHTKEIANVYIACKHCKYNYEGECDFYAMGSGREEDMPCYREKELIRQAAETVIEVLADKEVDV